jgi:AGZA family xanthine/uracil permease-like MFS transporter
VNRDLITATAAIAGLGSFMFGFLTNLPVALALVLVPAFEDPNPMLTIFSPGMGLNAYFTYQVVGFHGTGPVTYGMALTAVFVEGFIFVFLSLIGMRQWLVKVIPSSIKLASGAGIGLFLTEIGMSYSAGIGLITGSIDTPTDLGGCQPQYRDPATGDCDSHKMANPTVRKYFQLPLILTITLTTKKLWIGVMCGGVLTAYLMSYKIKSAIIIGIAVVSILSWP